MFKLITLILPQHPQEMNLIKKSAFQKAEFIHLMFTANILS